MKHEIEGFLFTHGWHCWSNSYRMIFRYYDWDMSEDMILGLAEGLSFGYFDYKGMPFPFVGARENIGPFEENLSRNTGIAITIHTTSSPKKAYTAMKEMIISGQPVMVSVDMPYLSYLGIPPDAHFGGHAVVIFGLDEEEGVVYLSDRDGPGFKVTMNPKEHPADFHKVPLAELEKARNSKFKPFPPQNKWLTFDFALARKPDKTVILRAVGNNVEKMTRPPIRNLGLKGITTFAERLVQWKEFDDERLKGAAFNFFIMFTEYGGCGGGGFRRMYGRFLKEAANIAGLPELAGTGDEYLQVAEQWQEVAYRFKALFGTVDRKELDSIAQEVRRIGERETEIINRLGEIVEENKV